MNESSDPQTQEQTENEISQTSSDRTDEKPFVDQGITELIVKRIRSNIDTGRLASTDIDSRVCEQLRSFPNDDDSINSLFDEFENSDLTGVVNKSAFLSNLIKQWKLKNPKQENSTNETTNSSRQKPGPNETKLKEILERTKYKIEITVGQRKYGGPPPDGPDRPATNSEVFIGKLPREIFEDELIPLCEEAGKIWDLRLMIDPTSGFNKGYCFVTFCEPGDARKAVERLNAFSIRPGKLIKANVSVANTRLFIGNIPKTKSKEEIHEEISKVVQGVADVIVYAPAEEADKKKNRGFCFIDFDEHKNASVAKRKLSNGRFRLFNREIAVDWADPDEEPDDVTMAQVKVLYVKNLTVEVSENDVKDMFLPYGSIERVRKLRDYAFVHFDKREDALNAMNALNGKELGRTSIEISLAKPLSEKRKQAQMKREQRKNQDFPVDSRAPMFHGGASNFVPNSNRFPSNQRAEEFFNQPDFGAFGQNEVPTRNFSATHRNSANGNDGRARFPNRPGQRANFHQNNNRAAPNSNKNSNGDFFNQGQTTNFRSSNFGKKTVFTKKKFAGKKTCGFVVFLFPAAHRRIRKTVRSANEIRRSKTVS